MGGSFRLNSYWVIILKYSRIYNILIDTVVIITGCALYAFGFSAFIEPNPIAPGGATGAATIIHSFLDSIPVGTLIIIINLPLFVIGFKKFHFGFVLKTALATFLTSALIDIFDLVIPKYNNDIILASLAGGVLTGAGLAFIMLRGATTGGTEIVAKLLNLKYRFLSMGRLILIVDTVVVVVAALVDRSFETVLYSALYLFTMSVIMDKLLYGADHGKLLFIITANPVAMLSDIIHVAGRGVTQVKVLGGYTQTERTMLLCVARSPEVTKVMQVIKENDRNSFVIVTDAGEILGEGFRRLDI